MTLTKKRREAILAIGYRTGGYFHRLVMEDLERQGLIQYIGGLRLVGMNSLPEKMFALTPAGVETGIALGAQRVTEAA